uniref:Cytochrome P450 n=1 Tax=Laodelphax striatellus TaxID=195883 RepID=A0A386RUZ7_LAOST|nr:cytochrome P450 [Laodelphax striatellus]
MIQLAAFYALFAVLAWFISFLISKRRHLMLAKHFHGPPALPLLGNALQFARISHNELIATVSELEKKYNSPCRFWLGTHLVIGVADADSMEAVLRSSENMDKSQHHTFFSDFIGGVFLAEGERWKRLRKMVMSPMFQASSMEGHVQIFNEQSRLMCQLLLKYKIGKGSFDIRPLMSSCVLDIICQTAMGTPMGVQLRDDVSYPKDISEIAEITMERSSKVWLHPNIVFNNTLLGNRKNELAASILNFVKSVIKTRRDIKTNEKQGISEAEVKSPYKKFVRPYLDSMLDYAEEEKLTEDRLALEVNDLMVAGSDTSAVASSHALVMLGMDEELQERVYAELREIFGDSDRPATLEDLAMMTQLEMVVKETVRITCPPHMARTVERDIILPGKEGAKERIIPTGATVYMLLYNLHRNPKYWSHPHEFHPDHFLPEYEATRPKFSYLPFSYGLRICPGYKYGVYSIKTVLSTVLRKFKVKSNLDKNNLNFRLSIMLELADGYPVTLEPRVPSE